MQSKDDLSTQQAHGHGEHPLTIPPPAISVESVEARDSSSAGPATAVSEFEVPTVSSGSGSVAVAGSEAAPAAGTGGCPVPHGSPNQPQLQHDRWCVLPMLDLSAPPAPPAAYYQDALAGAAASVPMAAGFVSLPEAQGLRGGSQDLDACPDGPLPSQSPRVTPGGTDVTGLPKDRRSEGHEILIHTSSFTRLRLRAVCLPCLLL